MAISIVISNIDGWARGRWVIGMLRRLADGVPNEMKEHISEIQTRLTAFCQQTARCIGRCIVQSSPCITHESCIIEYGMMHLYYQARCKLHAACCVQHDACCGVQLVCTRGAVGDAGQGCGGFLRCRCILQRISFSTTPRPSSLFGCPFKPAATDSVWVGRQIVMSLARWARRAIDPAGQHTAQWARF